MALSVLDEHFAEAPGGPRSTTKQRWTRRQKGLTNYRLFRVCGRLFATNVDGSFQFIDDIRNLQGQRDFRPQRAVIVEHRDALKFRHKLGRVSPRNPLYELND